MTKSLQANSLAHLNVTLMFMQAEETRERKQAAVL